MIDRIVEWLRCPHCALPLQRVEQSLRCGGGHSFDIARQGYVSPDDFTLMVSINVLCLIIIGGMGSLPGVILGSFVLIGLPEVLRSAKEWRMMLFGALLVAMMIFRPEGLLPSRIRKLEFEEQKDSGE